MEYPYLPPNRTILYVPEDHPMMQAAKDVAQEQSLDSAHPTGAVIVRDNTIIGKGANGSDYHEKYGCERKRLNIPTGEGYDLCDGCHPKNHAEQKAIADANKNNRTTEGADLYLHGHWWCCQSCWGKMIEAGIKDVYLSEDTKK